MTMITDLTIKVIYIILEQKIIDIEDVINFSLTCRRFNDALDNNLLWQTKLYQRWPYLKKIYDNRIQNKESINFKDEIEASVKCRKVLFSYLSLLSQKLFNHDPFQPCKPSDSDLKNFDILFRPNIGAHPMNYHFLKDKLLYQIKMSPLYPKCNLAHQYYSKIVLPFLQRRHHTEDVCLEFMNYSKKQASLRGIQNDYNNRKSVEASRPTEDILKRFEMTVQCMNVNLNISRIRIKPKNRTRNMEYAVGMIVTCQLENGSKQTGVIIGWDKIFNPHVVKKYLCNPDFIFVFLKHPECVTLYSNFYHCDTTRQPYYIILSENGKVCYAAQDSLIETNSRWIEHSEIGRYFCRFTNGYYIPNEVLTRHYPYDRAILDIHRDQKQVARKKDKDATVTRERIGYISSSMSDRFKMIKYSTPYRNFKIPKY